MRQNKTKNSPVKQKQKPSFNNDEMGAQNILKKLTIGMAVTPTRSTFDTSDPVSESSEIATTGQSGSSAPKMSLDAAPRTERAGSRLMANGKPDPEYPDWYEDLSEDHVSAFKEVFDMLDSANTGSLNSDTLYLGLKRVDSGITRDEVDVVLRTLDKDGNGEIDFDEFLFHISQCESLQGTGDESTYTKRQRLFFSAITKFSLKTSLGDIERAHRKQAPHVLSHYTAGVRLIGLTDRQLAVQMKHMLKNFKKLDSPYAEPVKFVSGVGTSIHPKNGANVNKCCKAKVKQERKEEPKETEEHPTKQQSAVEQPYTIQASLRFLAGRGSVVAKLPDVHLLRELRQRLETDKFKNAMQEMQEEMELKDNGVKKKEEEKKTKTVLSGSSSPYKEKRNNEGNNACWWTVPRVERDKVPLPVLKIKYKAHRPTIEDLPNIREKTSGAINDYYSSLRRATVQTAWEHWDRLYSDKIKSKKLKENFREVYRAYLPHKEEEAFVVCPWIPGPFCHTHTFHSRSQSVQENILPKLERYARLVRPDSRANSPCEY